MLLIQNNNLRVGLLTVLYSKKLNGATLTLLGRIVPCGTMRASPQWPDRAAVHDTSRDYEIRCFLSPGAILSVENTRG